MVVPAVNHSCLWLSVGPCRAGLLTSGAVMLYTTYLVFSALSSEPYDESCMRGSGSTPRWVQVSCAGRLTTS
jgi:hypothetical protein